MRRLLVVFCGLIWCASASLGCVADSARCPGGGSNCSDRQDAPIDSGPQDDMPDGGQLDQPSEDIYPPDQSPLDLSIDPVADTQDDLVADPQAEVALDSGMDGDLGGHDGSAAFRLDVQPQLTLPYTVEGSPVPTGQLEVYEVGGMASTEPLALAVQGPFQVIGDLSPLQANETRLFSVSYTGPVADPVIANGSVHLSADGQSVEAGLGAVVGDSRIPEAVWTADRYGHWTLIDLPSAPFPHPSASWTDSTVLILVPAGLYDWPDVNLVLHLHGHNAIVEEKVAAQWLGEQQALSGRNAVLVAPQGPVSYPSGNFGKLHDPGGAANLARDVFSVLYRDGFVERPLLGDTVLTSHSGGYLATADILDLGGLAVLGVQLYDSLYGMLDSYERFALAGGGLRSNYTSGGGTGANNQTLAGLLDDHLPLATTFGDVDLWSYPVIIGFTAADHSNCMFHERAAARWLTTSGLAPRPDAGPELLGAVWEDGQVIVTWRPDLGAANTSYRVQGSWDGSSWETLADTNLTQASVSGRPHLRIVRHTEGWGTSDPSDTYGATGDRWLIVDGFDRVLGGSYLSPTHSFAASLGVAVGESFSIASNEAVLQGLVHLSDYDRVLWMLGDEGLRDLTFDTTERTLVKDYVNGGGKLVVTGSEVGYASDRTWLSQVLHVTYVSDDANTNQAGDFTFGVTYEEDYPDVLSGQTTIWTYATGGAAAVIWNSQVIAVGFPLETLADSQRSTAVQQLIGWLE
ncbi:MAG: hypothetical protein JW797_05665 [Bradymonadales bacterium]|nr:hypothetical protein [Bradymonadales bacterium]